MIFSFSLLPQNQRSYVCSLRGIFFSLAISLCFLSIHPDACPQVWEGRCRWSAVSGSELVPAVFVHIFVHSFIYYLYSVHLLLGIASFAGDREIRKTETLEVERPSGCKKPWCAIRTCLQILWDPEGIKPVQEWKWWCWQGRGTERSSEMRWTSELNLEGEVRFDRQTSKARELSVLGRGIVYAKAWRCKGTCCCWRSD